MHGDVSVAFEGKMQVGECPLWHPDEAALYWVDIDGFAVHRLHPESGRHQRWQMPSEPSALARCASGGLIVAMRSGFFHLDTMGTRKLLDMPADSPAPLFGSLLQIAQAPYDTATTRFNDGRVDCAGRFWVGTLYEPRNRPAAAMYYLERGRVHQAWEGGMTNSNGLAFAPDQRRMYHADTASHTIRRMAFDPASAQVGPLEVFQSFSADKQSPSYGGRPDGAAVDAEGAYWVAMFEGARLLRFAPDGAQLDEVKLPVRCPTMVAFGGADLRTLFVTSARHNRSEAELAQYPLSGAVLSLRVDVPGRVEHAYLP